MNSACLAVALLLCSSVIAIAQSDHPTNTPAPNLPNFQLENGASLKIVRDTVPAKPFTVVGPRGAILGQQDGAFEG
jgi:hypothetical protein